MCAGMSSRFGGKIKQFAKVGKNDETLIEVSMNQAIKAGFKEIIFIIGNMTEAPFKEKFGSSYKEVPVKYAKQTFDPKERDKPWGTVDALVCAKDVIDGPFALCNGDDIYGREAFEAVKDFLEKETNPNAGVSVGYELGKVVSENGGVNRGVYSFNKENFITGLVEYFNIEKDSLKEQGLNEKTLVSMNLFGLNKNILDLLIKKLEDFKKTNAGDRKAECLLPVELGNLIKENKIKIKLLPTKDQWFGVTNPDDEPTVRAALAKVL